MFAKGLDIIGLSLSKIELFRGDSMKKIHVKKNIKRMGCAALAAVLTLSGCGMAQPESEETLKEGGVVNIYSWNTEFQGIYDQYAADPDGKEHQHPGRVWLRPQ